MPRMNSVQVISVPKKVERSSKHVAAKMQFQKLTAYAKILKVSKGNCAALAGSSVRTLKWSLAKHANVAAMGLLPKKGKHAPEARLLMFVFMLQSIF